jgi:hypothetical protein
MSKNKKEKNKRKMAEGRVSSTQVDHKKGTGLQILTKLSHCGNGKNLSIISATKPPVLDTI